jgi:hypothetical protein
MSNKRDLLDEVCRQEDAAREIAHNIASSGCSHVDADIVEDLARTVARLAQAVRDTFEGITTSDFRR